MNTISSIWVTNCKNLQAEYLYSKLRKKCLTIEGLSNHRTIEGLTVKTIQATGVLGEGEKVKWKKEKIEKQLFVEISCDPKMFFYTFSE